MADEVLEAQANTANTLAQFQAGGVATAAVNPLGGSQGGNHSQLHHQAAQDGQMLQHCKQQSAEFENMLHGLFANKILVANNPSNLYLHAKLSETFQEGVALNYQQQGRRKQGGLFNGFQSKVKLEGFPKEYLNKIRGQKSQSKRM